MRKEVLLAIIAGALFGLVIAFGIWKANSVVKPENETSQINNTQETYSPTPQSGTGLTIAKPEENSVFTQNPATITGITNPNAWVVISGESEDYIVKADNQGGFSRDIELAGGVNEIIITAIDENGVQSTQKLLAVFSTEFE